MSPVSRDSSGGRAYLDLQAKARQEGRPTDELFTTYVLERFLWRVAHSAHRERLVLKGGMLLAVFAERRPTADVDLLALRTVNEVAAVATLIRQVVAVECDDGVGFDVAQLRAGLIREQDAYPGVRVVVPAMIDRARSTLRVDVNVGDPVTPAPTIVYYPALLAEPFTVVGYPLETILAEKLVTMMDRGELTTRERDFADVYMLMARHALEADSLLAAIDATIAHRGSQRRPLRTALGDLGSKRQTSWERYLARSGLVGVVPRTYDETIDTILVFAEELLTGSLSETEWDPASRSWR